MEQPTGMRRYCDKIKAECMPLTDSWEFKLYLYVQLHAGNASAPPQQMYASHVESSSSSVLTS